MVSRAKQDLPVILLEIPVRPSWTKIIIIPSEIWRKVNQKEGANPQTSTNAESEKRIEQPTSKATMVARTGTETEVFAAAAKRNTREKARGGKSVERVGVGGS